MFDYPDDDRSTSTATSADASFGGEAEGVQADQDQGQGHEQGREEFQSRAAPLEDGGEGEAIGVAAAHEGMEEALRQMRRHLAQPEEAPVPPALSGSSVLPSSTSASMSASAVASASADADAYSVRLAEASVLLREKQEVLQQWEAEIKRREARLREGEAVSSSSINSKRTPTKRRRGGGRDGADGDAEEVSSPAQQAVSMAMLREKEERILALEADLARCEEEKETLRKEKMQREVEVAGLQEDLRSMKDHARRLRKKVDVLQWKADNAAAEAAAANGESKSAAARRRRRTAELALSSREKLPDWALRLSATTDVRGPSAGADGLSGGRGRGRGGASAASASGGLVARSTEHSGPGDKQRVAYLWGPVLLAFVEAFVHCWDAVDSAAGSRSGARRSDSNHGSGHRGRSTNGATSTPTTQALLDEGVGIPADAPWLRRLCSPFLTTQVVHAVFLLTQGVDNRSDRRQQRSVAGLLWRLVQSNFAIVAAHQPAATTATIDCSGGTAALGSRGKRKGRGQQKQRQQQQQQREQAGLGAGLADPGEWNDATALALASPTAAKLIAKAIINLVGTPHQFEQQHAIIVDHSLDTDELPPQYREEEEQHLRQQLHDDAHPDRAAGDNGDNGDGNGNRRPTAAGAAAQRGQSRRSWSGGAATATAMVGTSLSTGAVHSLLYSREADVRVVVALSVAMAATSPLGVTVGGSKKGSSAFLSSTSSGPAQAAAGLSETSTPFVRHSLDPHVLRSHNREMATASESERQFQPASAVRTTEARANAPRSVAASGMSNGHGMWAEGSGPESLHVQAVTAPAELVPHAMAALCRAASSDKGRQCLLRHGALHVVWRHTASKVRTVARDACNIISQFATYEPASDWIMPFVADEFMLFARSLLHEAWGATLSKLEPLLAAMSTIALVLQRLSEHGRLARNICSKHGMQGMALSTVHHIRGLERGLPPSMTVQPNSAAERVTKLLRSVRSNLEVVVENLHVAAGIARAGKGKRTAKSKDPQQPQPRPTLEPEQRPQSQHGHLAAGRRSSAPAIPAAATRGGTAAMTPLLPTRTLRDSNLDVDDALDEGLSGLDVVDTAASAPRGPAHPHASAADLVQTGVLHHGVSTATQTPDGEVVAPAASGAVRTEVLEDEDLLEEVRTEQSDTENEEDDAVGQDEDKGRRDFVRDGRDRAAPAAGAPRVDEDPLATLDMAELRGEVEVAVQRSLRYELKQQTAVAAGAVPDSEYASSTPNSVASAVAPGTLASSARSGKRSREGQIKPDPAAAAGAAAAAMAAAAEMSVEPPLPSLQASAEQPSAGLAMAAATQLLAAQRYAADGTQPAWPPVSTHTHSSPTISPLTTSPGRHHAAHHSQMHQQQHRGAQGMDTMAGSPLGMGMGMHTTAAGSAGVGFGGDAGVRGGPMRPPPEPPLAAQGHGFATTTRQFSPSRAAPFPPSAVPVEGPAAGAAAPPTTVPDVSSADSGVIVGGADSNTTASSSAMQPFSLVSTNHLLESAEQLRQETQALRSWLNDSGTPS